MNDSIPAQEPSPRAAGHPADEDPAYQATLDYLYSYIDYSLQRNLRNAPGKFDLGRMRAFLDLLGRPQDKYPIIHVAGTKGKGSVSAMIASVLRAQGYRVGLYTSPHLEDYAERIQVGGGQAPGGPIPHADLIGLVEELKPFIQAVPQISTFEITTALGLYYFAMQMADAAVVEVGLGGRLDATNVVEPVISVITSLSYDHMALLGNTLAEIAAEKAGIVKPGVPVVLGPQQEEARQVVERIAGERGARLVQVDAFGGGAAGSRGDFYFEPLSHSLEGQELFVWPASGPGDGAGEALRLAIPLLGAHQVENAALAVAALRTAAGRGLPVSDDAIRRGLAQVSWPGRFELLRRDPPLVIDAAHNRDSAGKLRRALDDYFPGAPVILVTGESEDKDIEGIFAELVPRVEQVIVTQAVHPRAADPGWLAGLVQAHGRPASVAVPVSEALDKALHVQSQRIQAQGQGDKTPVVLATGSLFVIAEVRTAWRKRSGFHERQ
jgi:dihydrofolate synthase/folylpolyglutamate synthase